MEMTTRLSRGMQHALVDLEHFAREITESPANQKKLKATKETPRRPETGLYEDPVVPWIKGIMAALIVVAGVIFLNLLTQFPGF